MKKYIFLYILCLEIFTNHAYASAHSQLNGEYAICPQGQVCVYTAEAIFHNYDIITWEVKNGHFDTPDGPKKKVISASFGMSVRVYWDNVAEEGVISYSIPSYPYNITGYANVEILSVKNAAMDALETTDEFHPIISNTINLPLGFKGSLQFHAFMIYPSTRGSSPQYVKNFLWNLPPSLGGKIINGNEYLTINYDKTSGNGEKIIVTPIGCNGTQGKPTTITIVRKEIPPVGPPDPGPVPDKDTVDNRFITGEEYYERDSLLLTNILVAPSAKVSFNGHKYVWLKKQFEANKGCWVHITAGYKAKNLTKANIEETFSGASQKHISGFSQNYPNPCWGNTKIDYYLPENTRNAVLYVVSSTGETVRNLSLYERDSGTLNLDISGLSPGFYLYYIVADGQMIGSKRMIVTNR